MRFCNVHLGPGGGGDAYKAMYALKRYGSTGWSVESDEEVAQVLGHCSIPFDALTDDMTEDEVIEAVAEVLRERWPAVRVWVTEEDV
jgi:hypothetical protein